MFRHKKLFIVVFLAIFFLSSLFAFYKIPSVGGAVIFQDGFESGDFSAWLAVEQSSGDNASVTEARQREGLYSGKFQTTAIASGVKYARVVENFTAGLAFYIRGYFYIESGLPLVDADDRFSFMNFWYGSTLMGTIQVRRVAGEDRFAIVTHGTSVITTTEVYPEMGKWYSIEFYLKIHATAGETKGWIDGVQHLSKTGYNNTYGSVTQLDRAKFGNVYTVNVQQEVTVYGDSAVLADSYIGPIYEPPLPSDVYFQDGFETADFSKWNGTSKTSGETATVVTTDPHHGSYHADFASDGSGTGERSFAYVQLNQTYSTIYVRVYYRFTGLSPSSGGYSVSSPNLRNYAAGRAVAYVDVKNELGTYYFRLYYMDGASSVTVKTSEVAVLNTWYSIEVYVKVHGSEGAYKLWIDDKEVVSLSGKDSDEWGGVDLIQVGERWASEAFAHSVYVDDVVVAGSYIGPEEPPAIIGAWGLVGDPNVVQRVTWIESMFVNQTIDYTLLYPYEVTDYDSISQFGGLVVFTTGGSEATYNVSAVKTFAQTKPVLINVKDFAHKFYPSLGSEIWGKMISTVEYLIDWGNFKVGDEPVFNNWETDGSSWLYTCNWTALNAFGNVTNIAKYDDTFSAYWRMAGGVAGSGFYSLDLNGVTPETEWAGIYHIFPVIELVSGVDIKPGKYGRWFATGVDHWSYDTVMTWLANWVSNAPAGMNATLRKIGTSVQSRDINATFFGNGSRYIIIDSSIHGNEKQGTPAVLRLLEVVQENFEANGYWKDRLSEVSLVVIPILNPDGYVANTRKNANGVDLNRQFPPGGTTTEPEAWALRWLWGNYTTIIYINNHEGRHWYPASYLYGQYLPDYPVDVKAFTLQNCYFTRDDFEALNHWGTYDESGVNHDIGTIRQITQTGISSAAVAGASYLHNISSYLFESFVWSSSYGGYYHKARQMLFAMDYYITANLGMISQFDRLHEQNFLVVTEGNIKSFSWSWELLLEIDTTELSALSTSITKIDVGDRAKPLKVLIDGVEKAEGDGWTWDTAGIVTVTGATYRVQVRWEEEVVPPQPPGPSTLDPPYVAITLVSFAVGGGAGLAYWGYRRSKKAKEVKV